MPSLTSEKFYSAKANLVLYPAPSSKPPAVAMLVWSTIEMECVLVQKFTSEFYVIHAVWHIDSTKMYNDFTSKKV